MHASLPSVTSSPSSLHLSDLRSFSSTIAYRYDVFKQLRLSVACAYLRYVDTIDKQRASAANRHPSRRWTVSMRTGSRSIGRLPLHPSLW